MIVLENVNKTGITLSNFQTFVNGACILELVVFVLPYFLRLQFNKTFTNSVISTKIKILKNKAVLEQRGSPAFATVFERASWCISVNVWTLEDVWPCLCEECLS